MELLPSFQPSLFATTPFVTKSDYILHLSDLHFNDLKHGFAMGPETEAKKRLSTIIHRTIATKFKDVPPAAIIVSGDLTYFAKPEEYEVAHEFLRTLRSAWGLDTHQFVVIPGNHDIAWEKSPPPAADGSVSLSGPEAEKNYREFYHRFFGVAPNAFLSMGRRYILSNYNAVDVLAVNSSRLEQKDFPGHGYVSVQQFDEAYKAMGWQTDDSEIKHRLMVLHHHLVPVSAREDISAYDNRVSLSVDAGQIIHRALEAGVDLTLHGHMHQPFLSSIARPTDENSFPADRMLTIHATGSAGVKREYTGAVGKNAFSVIKFAPRGGISIAVFTQSQQNAESFSEEHVYKLETSPSGGTKIVA